MAMAALRLRRHHLLADPTRFLSIRIEPQIHLIRSTAAAASASFPSQRPTHFGSSIHPQRTPSPCSTPSAAPMSIMSIMSICCCTILLLHDTVGPHAISCLLEEPRDLLNKMERPSDERLIVYHASFLTIESRIWFYLKLYRLYFKVIPFADDKGLTDLAVTALGEMAYTSPLERSAEDIINGHSLLAHIDSKKPKRDTEAEAMLENFSSPTAGMYVEPKAGEESRRLGRLLVAIHRHAIEHAFDKEARQVRSKPSTEAKAKRLWKYSLYQVVDLLRTCLPVYLLKVQETFVRSELWDYLEIDTYWARNLTWMGGVPKPTKAEHAAIKPSYGKRRQQARKFDKFNRGTSADTNESAGDQEGIQMEEE